MVNANVAGRMDAVGKHRYEAAIIAILTDRFRQEPDGTRFRTHHILGTFHKICFDTFAGDYGPVGMS
jgi:hypothetical protein